MNDLTLNTTLTANAGPLNGVLRSTEGAISQVGATAAKVNKAQEEGAKAVTGALDAQTAATKGATAATAADNAIRQAAAAARQAEQQAMRSARAEVNQLTQAYRQLPAQITDVTTSLASGMPLWLVAIQQGGQIKDSFGGIVPAGRALAGTLTAVRLAAGGAVGVLGALALAYNSGSGEADAYTRALVLSGNASGTTRDQLADMARQIDGTIGTQAKAAEALAAMASTGRVAAGDLQNFATVAVQMERATGQAVDETAKAFAALGKEPLAATIKLNEGSNYLTVSLYEQIRALTEAGRTTEAARVAQTAYADAMSSRATEIVAAQGLIERGWNRIKDATSDAIDAVLDVGRKQTLTQRLAEIKAELDGVAGGRGRAAYVNSQAPVDERVQAALRGEAAGINRTLLLQSESAANKVMIDEYRKAREENQRWADAALSNAEKVQKQLNQYRRANQAITDGGGTLDPLQVQREEAAILAGLKLQDEKIKRARQRDKPFELVGPLDDFDSFYKAANVGQITAGRDPTRAARAADLAGYGATDEALRAQNNASAAAARELVATNRSTSIALITDARTRGEAQIAIEEEQLRARLDLQGLNAEDQKRVSDELATWRVQREQQLTNDLKPEWQRMVDAWGDTNRLMQDSFDATVNASIRSGEDAWVRFAQTGKLSVRSLVDTIIAEQARQGYRSLMGQLGSLIGSYGSLTVDTGGYGITPGDGSIPLPTRGGAATGSNYIERDMLTMLHKGEAVIPKAYNPAAGGSGYGGGAPQVTIINNTGTQATATAQQGSDGGIEVILSAVKDSIAGDIGNGSGSVWGALKMRAGLRDTFSS